MIALVVLAIVLYVVMGVGLFVLTDSYAPFPVMGAMLWPITLVLCGCNALRWMWRLWRW